MASPQTEPDPGATRCTTLLEWLAGTLEEAIDTVAAGDCLEHLAEIASALRLASDLLVMLEPHAGSAKRAEPTQ